ncbi:ATPase, T2SS/T4P/T4SS family [Paenibacillus antibioticophila]|uniref:ATPase, T2SS/T4P/T4SS family n=1 Tax=Paenibacillus antibioticophila TaxID=1274374 RepID=UPI0005CADC10|nr:ATPase, T2SS/T4P/T4SS family [Paenibacillus antibioticophila]
MNSHGWNTFILVSIITVMLAFLWFKIRTHNSASASILPVHDPYAIPELIKYVKRELHELSRNPEREWSLNEEAWARRVRVRTELRQALRGAAFGDVQDKAYVKSFIKDLLLNGYGVQPDNIDRIIPFEERERLSAQDQFEILLYLYALRNGDGALTALMEEYELDRLRHPTDGELGGYYEINADDICDIYYREGRRLLFEEKLELVVQRIYQMYKGYSVIDAIREQRIDGVSGGVSGVTGAALRNILDQSDPPDKGKGLDGDGLPVTSAWDSVWIFYKGKSIRLSFLTFGSEAELKRVCQNIYKYNLPGQLSEANGYKVNEMKDGSRVVVVRPPFAETWAFFIRKFDIQNATLPDLILGRNAVLPITLLKYLMKGGRITAITGAQGSGKTTLLMALVRHIDPTYTLRVQEMSFELNLRRIYSSRNILSFKETNTVSGQAGLDLQKKTDGTVHILGEVATDEVASWMIQTAQVASLFTVFTHHAKTFRNLIESLRNSLLKSGVFRDETIAEQQVADVIDFDIHLCKDAQGNRYIERITECCREAGDEETGRGFLGRRKSYNERTIVEYRDGAYVAVEPLSLISRTEMAKSMQSQDAVSFLDFTDEVWRENIGA